MSNRRRVSPAAWILIAPIRFYQRFITPYTPATCRFYPTCSSYAVTALREHGALRGTWLTVRRLGRCHPWSAGGIDHVPPRRGRTSGEQPGQAGSSLSAAPVPTGPAPVQSPARPAASTDRSTAA